jgi:hypothetical protein
MVNQSHPKSGFTMRQQKFNVNRLRIASPCSVAWDKMIGNERTRFCDLCELNVYDISSMARSEVEELVESKKGRLCLRLYRRVDGTVLTRDCPVGLRDVRKRIGQFAGATMAVILGLFSISFPQTDEDWIDATKVKIVRTPQVGEESELFGIVADQMGAIVPNAKIILKGMKQERIVFSDGDGAYVFSGVRPGTYTLQVVYTGFDGYFIKNVTITGREKLELRIELQSVPATIGVLAADESLPVETNAEPLFNFEPLPRKPIKPLP